MKKKQSRGVKAKGVWKNDKACLVSTSGGYDQAGRRDREVGEGDLLTGGEKHQ